MGIFFLWGRGMVWKKKSSIAPKELGICADFLRLAPLWGGFLCGEARRGCGLVADVGEGVDTDLSSTFGIGWSKNLRRQLGRREGRFVASKVGFKKSRDAAGRLRTISGIIGLSNGRARSFFPRSKSNSGRTGRI